MTDSQVPEASIEPIFGKLKHSWALYTALGTLLGVAYASWSLSSPPPPAYEPSSAAPAAGDSVQSQNQTAQSAAAAADPIAADATRGTPDHSAQPARGDSQVSARFAASPGEVADSIETNAPPTAADGEGSGLDSKTHDAAMEYATNGSFFVQVASYRSQEHADARARELAQRGLPAQSFAYGGPAAGWWHAVRLGPFEERAAAERSRLQMRMNERREAYVLPRANGKYHVQVASLAQRENAEKVAQRLAAEGHSTKISRVRMAGQRWHCVRIGPFDTRQEALEYQQLVGDIPGGKSEVIPFAPPSHAADS